MLRSKPIRSSRGPQDGLRVSVMSRHTLNDGVTPDHSIKPDMFDEWWPTLAPPARLIGDYRKRGLPWSEFEERFAAYLDSPVAGATLEVLVRLALAEDVTVLCTEPEPLQCHRRLIVGRAQLLHPDLRVDIH